MFDLLGGSLAAELHELGTRLGAQLGEIVHHDSKTLRVKVDVGERREHVGHQRAREATIRLRALLARRIDVRAEHFAFADDQLLNRRLLWRFTTDTDWSCDQKKKKKTTLN